MPTTNLFGLHGRVAVVTGGNGGIGRGIALGLAQPELRSHTDESPNAEFVLRTRPRPKRCLLRCGPELSAVGFASSMRQVFESRSADQLEHCSNRGCTGDPVQSRIEATHLGCFALGIDSILGQRSQDRVQDDQCAGRNGRYGAIVPPGLQKTTLSDPGGRILRVQESARWKTLCICRSREGLE